MNLTGQELYNAVIADPRYAQGLRFGIPRPGHEEGTIESHIDQLQLNIFRLRGLITQKEFWDLQVLIVVHDIMKGVSLGEGKVAITHPQSHASLAAKFLAEFSEDRELIDMVQFHDEGLALYRQWREKGKYSLNRYTKLVDTIRNWDTFLIFTLLDGFTPSKEPEKIRWFVDEVNKVVSTPRVYKAMEIFGI